jgi:hypothetical protein
LNTQNRDNAKNQESRQGCDCEEPPLLALFSFIGLVVGGTIGVLIGKRWLIFSIIGAALFSGIYHYIHNYRKKKKLR